MSTAHSKTASHEGLTALVREALFRLVWLCPEHRAEIRISDFPIPGASGYDMRAFAQAKGSWGIRIRDHRDPDKAELRLLADDPWPSGLTEEAVATGLIEIIRRCLTQEEANRDAFFVRCSQAGVALDCGSFPLVESPKAAPTNEADREYLDPAYHDSCGASAQRVPQTTRDLAVPDRKRA